MLRSEPKSRKSNQFLSTEPSCQPTEMGSLSQGPFTSTCWGLLHEGCSEGWLAVACICCIRSAWVSVRVSPGALALLTRRSALPGRPCKGCSSGDLPKAQQGRDCSVVVHACEFTGKKETKARVRKGYATLCGGHLGGAYRIGSHEITGTPEKRPSRLLGVQDFWRWVCPGLNEGPRVMGVLLGIQNCWQ